MTKYLTEVMKVGLVRLQREERFYVITSKGVEFLEKYRKFLRSNKHLEKRLNDVHNNKKALEDLCSGR